MSTTPADLARLRRTEPKICAWCGNGFLGLKVSRFCSESCKQKAKRDRAKMLADYASLYPDGQGFTET